MKINSLSETFSSWDLQKDTQSNSLLLPCFPAAPLVVIFLVMKGKVVWGKVNWAPVGYVSSGLQSSPPKLNNEASYFGFVFLRGRHPTYW